jgi:hypothetical protein
VIEQQVTDAEYAALVPSSMKPTYWNAREEQEA